jgi:hypothetical protein
MGGFVEEDGGCRCGVEGLYARGYGDADTSVCRPLDLFRQPLAFVTDEQGDGLAPVKLPWGQKRPTVRGVGIGFAGAGSDGSDINDSKLSEENGQGDANQEGKMEGSASGGAQGLRGKRTGGSALARGGCDGSCGAKSGSGAKDGTDIAGILEAGKHDNERGSSCGIPLRDIVERVRAGSDQSSDTLRVFCVGNALKEPIGGAKDWDADFRAIEIRRESCAIAFARLAEQDRTDWTGGTQSFFYESRAFDTDGSGFSGQAASECHAKFLKPFVIAGGNNAGGYGGGNTTRGHAESLQLTAKSRKRGRSN